MLDQFCHPKFHSVIALDIRHINLNKILESFHLSYPFQPKMGNLSITLCESLTQIVSHSPNVSTTPLRQWVFRQCLPFSWTTLRGKHCRHSIALMGVVDTFGHRLKPWIKSQKDIPLASQAISLKSVLKSYQTLKKPRSVSSNIHKLHLMLS